MPEKPYPEYPLFLHQNRQYCKKIKGRFVYFGTDWQKAKKKYHAFSWRPFLNLQSGEGPIPCRTETASRSRGSPTYCHHGTVEWTSDKLTVYLPVRCGRLPV